MPGNHLVNFNEISILKEFFSDWLPKWIEPKHVLEQVKIPQVDYFSFGEKLAVAEHGTSDPESIGFIYSKISALLASDFEDLPSFIGKEFYDLKKKENEKGNESRVSLMNRGVESYEYDVFISHSHSSLTNLWISEFGSVFTEYLAEELGVIHLNYLSMFQEVSVGGIWSEALINALKKSKVLLTLLSPDYLSNTPNMLELESFLEKEKQTNKKLIIPIILKSFDYNILPLELKSRDMIDFSEFNIEDVRKSTKLKVRFAQKVEKVAEAISLIIKDRSIEGLEVNLNSPKLKDNFDKIYEEVRSLAKEYEELREKMPAGNNRTRLMQYVASKMTDAAPKLVPIIQNLIDSNSPGERLAAITALHTNPDPRYSDWLSDHVGDKEKPFIGYQAAVGLYLLTKAFGKTHKNEIAKAIEKAVANIEASSFKDPNQVKVLNTAKTELAYY